MSFHPNDFVHTKSVYFQLFQSTANKYYKIDPRWSIQELIEYCTKQITKDFHLQTFDLAEQIPGANVEDSVAISKRDYATLVFQKYGPALNISFWIRPLSECVVCWEFLPLVPYYPCSHRLCYSCRKNCITHKISKCPICRRQLLT